LGFSGETSIRDLRSVTLTLVLGVRYKSVSVA